VIVSCTFSFWAVCWPGTQSTTRDNHGHACNFAKYSLILKNFYRRITNKHFLIWLLITLSHFKYVVMLHCNLSLMACFADINVSQGSVATYARCDGSFNIHLTTNFPRKNCLIGSYLTEFCFRLWVCGPTFLAHPVCFCASDCCCIHRVFPFIMSSVLLNCTLIHVYQWDEVHSSLICTKC